MKDAETRVVYIDTSFLTRMPSGERGNWERLLAHAKLCKEKLDTKPRLDIYISEIALSEYKTKMVDVLYAKIGQTNNKLTALLEEWNVNPLGQIIEYPFPTDRNLFPSKDDLINHAEKIVNDLLNNGINQIEKKLRHSEAVWERYFNWREPFNSSQPTERDDKKVREKRRTHIPDAWILEAAVDMKKEGHQMLCLCLDENMSLCLEAHGHKAYKNAEDILNILFPPEPKQPSAELSLEDNPQNPTEQRSSLDKLLVSAPNDNVKNIYLRLLGFIVALGTPSHTSLIDAVASNRYSKKLVEACAVILSDETRPFIKDTGTHYIVGDLEVCQEASDRVMAEIIELLEQG